MYEERIQEVEEELEALKLGKDEEVAKRVEFSTKFETLSSYFKEKEDGLHCRLSELQVKRLVTVSCHSSKILIICILILELKLEVCQ